MGVSNANYGTTLYTNEDLQKIQEFKTRIANGDLSINPELTSSLPSQSYSLEEDFLKKFEYKSIADLKNIRQSGFNVTMGTIKEVETEYGWWYRGYKDRLCAKSLKDIGGKYKCDGCGAEFTEFPPRYKLHLIGLNKDIFPNEIYAFKEQIMLFKVTCLEDNSNLQLLDDTSKTSKSLESSCEMILPIKRTATGVELSTDDDLERSVTSNVKSRRLFDEEEEKYGISTKMLHLDDSVRDD
ncbi:hypothetical protein PIB30_029949 [Stylosanthes scabra]|uniref:Replication factor A C-terminal domain-containing protein n=1 Tax=Stylosanthes scabra TaxID=79078 RepID=A0ABU6WCL7_9FABA|nr:hypothetical protein [Stylosanthes scabra]